MAATCLPPDPFTDPTTYFSLTDASGHRSSDLGNYNACLDGSFRHCVLSAGGISVGMCLPAACGVEDITNTSSPIFGSYIFSQANVIALMILSGRLTATCSGILDVHTRRVIYD